MQEIDYKALVRNFPENGIKLLLQHPENIRELLTIVHFDREVDGEPLINRMDFANQTHVSTTFIKQDYRHIEGDVLIKVPLKGLSPAKTGTPDELLIYILIEHQSTPDDFMSRRLIEYIIEVFKYQEREWLKTHKTLTDFEYHPVLPVVFYTGARDWSKIKPLHELVRFGSVLMDTIPTVRPLYLNLPIKDDASLESSGGPFGVLLELIRDRQKDGRIFYDAVHRVLSCIEGLSDTDQQRWVEFLSYIYALIYHERVDNERAELTERIQSSYARNKSNQETSNVARAVGKMFEDIVKLKVTRDHVRKLLERRFGSVPSNVSEAIDAADTQQQMDTWFEQAIDATSLDDLRVT